MIVTLSLSWLIKFLIIVQSYNRSSVAASPPTSSNSSSSSSAAVGPPLCSGGAVSGDDGGGGGGVTFALMETIRAQQQQLNEMQVIHQRNVEILEADRAELASQLAAKTSELNAAREEIEQLRMLLLEASTK